LHDLFLYSSKNNRSIDQIFFDCASTNRDECRQWDGICFLQNACGASLVRLFKSSFLAIISKSVAHQIDFIVWNKTVNIEPASD
jgi:hypothetical protein